MNWKLLLSEDEIMRGVEIISSPARLLIVTVNEVIRRKVERFPLKATVINESALIHESGVIQAKDDVLTAIKGGVPENEISAIKLDFYDSKRIVLIVRNEDLF